MSSISKAGQALRTVAPSVGGITPKSILARLDRISVWSLPFIFVGIIGTGFLFAFYDVFDINVSFIQSCVALKHGCTPANAVTALRVPVVLNLAGYVIGALILAQTSDRIGRRNMLLFTMLLILLRLELPESARWLVGQGRLVEADKVVSDMEVVAAKHGPLPPVPDDVPVDDMMPGRRLSFRALLSERLYVRRMVQLLGVWFLAYVTVFGFSAGLISMLVSLKYPPPEAGLITAIGAFGFLPCALFAVAFPDNIERKLWLPIGAVITVIGGVIVAEAGTTSLAIAFIGAAIVLVGFNIWVPMTYTLSTESFPTRARVTGFGVVDGVGHLGGGVGVLVIAPQIPNMTVLEAMLVVSGFLVLAAIVTQFSPNTRGRYYEEISP